MAIQSLPTASVPERSATSSAKASTHLGHAAAAEIIDIRRDTREFDILEDLHRGLRPEHGAEKTLPTLLLYDEKGLKLFEQLTYLDEYYLTNAEIEVLEKYADRIADRIKPNSLVVELGSGNLRKVNILLKALDRAQKNIQYFALDVNLDELKRTLADIPPGTYSSVKCSGLHGTYDDGLEWLKSPAIATQSKSLLWLGSSIGNFKREEARPFLKSVAESLQPGDTMLIGIDACNDPKKIYHAYNDRDGVTHQFVLNGLVHANTLDTSIKFGLDDWEVIGEYMYDSRGGRHHAFVSPNKDVVVDGVEITKGERIRIEESYKYSAAETQKLWESTGLVESSKWSNQTGDYDLHFVSIPKVFFPLKASVYAKNPVPSLEDWRGLWTAWDTVTREMIPKDELLSKPIKLRNVCLFYLGHIPTFQDIQLTRATQEPPSEPTSYPEIFERGIDPDVDDPTHCHSHSETPDEWPSLEDILAFQDRVRERVARVYKDYSPNVDNPVGRALWLGYEHEMMHLETLLYMLIQSDKTLPPPGAVKPDFESMAIPYGAVRPENQWFKIPEADISIGMNDARLNKDSFGYFGWDNEIPHRIAHVRAFEAQARAITIGDYAEYLKATGSDKVPASWYEPDRQDTAKSSNGVLVEDGELDILRDRFVRTVFGAVPLKYVLDWPVVASFEELSGYAKWSGGRIPTMEEVRSIYNYVHHLNTKEAAKALAKTIPAVNSHLINNGVQESPPVKPFSTDDSHGGLHELFVDLEGANVGFRQWHPVPVAQNEGKLCGQGELGGVWEWTSSVLKKHDSFIPMEDYPAYTADFFDGKHNIVLGGSWATHPNIAGRKTFVNWYQRNYPYVWAGARLVRDI